MIISSQDHRDAQIIADKRAAQDYGCLVSPVLGVDGETYQVLLDGHHSYEAAILDGVEPEYTIATPQDHDAVSLLEQGLVEEFLQAVHHGHDYRDVATGKFVW